MAGVRFEGVWKLFGDVPAVRDLDLEVQDGEFLVLVGPSGCGKTTSLRMLGGLETPSYGRIYIGEDDVTLTSPGRRDVAMVFQSYALYPHMTVYKNLAFGPTVRHEPRRELKARVQEVAEVLGIEGLLNRRPSELSGGQRQRVALGRSLMRKPQLFLLDEPLSNLDAALRVQMRTELIRLHNLLPVTTVYVTHDQVEALTMGDRVAVFHDGRLLQIGAPDDLYDNPATRFVASFLGSPTMNLLSGELLSGDGQEVRVRSLEQELVIGGRKLRPDSEVGAPVTVGVRPHDLYWAGEAPERCSVRLSGTVDLVEHTGTELFAGIELGPETKLMARLHRSVGVSRGDRIELALDPGDLHVFAADSEESILERRAPRSGSLPKAPQASPSSASSLDSDQQMSAALADAERRT
jgi:multiple sugar transport system ATP-binding protein